MNLLERVRQIRNVQSILGMQFGIPAQCLATLPGGSRLIGSAGPYAFCFIDGYQETVFAITASRGMVKPVAYDFSEFLRLIFACGCAENVAALVFSGEISQAPANQAELQKLQQLLELHPVENPEAYVKTVGQVIDCRAIR